MPKVPCFAVRRSKIQGRGVFATRLIRKGSRIVEYEGERITHKEADRRYDDEHMSRHHTMLFSVSRTACIDASRVGNDARYINHSCAPNCEAIQEGERVFIFAAIAIPRGTELTYDYRYEYDRSIGFAEAKRRYPCRCGSPECRGTIVLPPRKKTKKAAKKAEIIKPTKSVKAAKSVLNVKRGKKIAKSAKGSKT